MPIDDNFSNYPLVHRHSQVIVHDCVESVSDGDDSAVGKLGADGLLDEVVSLQVHSSGGFIKHQDLGLTEEGSRQTHQLPLTDTARRGRGVGKERSDLTQAIAQSLCMHPLQL